MKRSVRRSVDLPPFSIGLAELCLIWTRLDPMFDGEKDKSFYVDVEFEDETITLESIEELKNTEYQRSKSSTFTLHCHGTDRGLHIYTPPHSGKKPRLIVTAESEVWVAGAREVVLSIIGQNRSWHHWLQPAALDWIVLILLMVAAGAMAFSLGVNRGAQAADARTLGLAGSGLVLAWLLLGRRRLLPAATLRLKDVESFWRKYSVELTLALAFVSVIVAAAGLLIPKS
jgi:hypothetical protein